MVDKIESELEVLLPTTQWTRRGFVMTSLVTGFALSLQPVSAETIHTDATGLEAGEVKVPVKDGSIPGYRAMPDKGGAFPTVLVIHEAWGVHEHIKDVCRRLAKAGYFAIATELWARQGNAAEAKDIEETRKLMASVPTDQVISDLDATVAYAKSTGKADTKRRSSPSPASAGVDLRPGCIPRTIRI
jgi:carboxymethylenebutenolidase